VRGVVPSDVDATALVGACWSCPELLPYLVDALPARRDVIRKVREAYKRFGAVQDNVWRFYVWRWLVERGELLDELLREARGGDLFALRTLARFHPRNARPLLRAGLKSRLPTVATLCAGILYKEDAALRGRLRRVAQDTRSGQDVRELAIEGLVEARRADDVGWLLGLAANSGGKANWLEDAVRTAPTTWMPRLVELLRSGPRKARDAAVDALMIALWEADPPCGTGARRLPVVSPHC